MVGQNKFYSGLENALYSVCNINHGITIPLPIPTGKLVIDTGTCVSIISNGLFYRIPPDHRLELRPVAGSFKLEVADDSLLPIDGMTTLEFKVNKDVFSRDFCVAPIREDGLIGLDFL